MAQKCSVNDQHGTGRWRTVEDLRSHLDPMVAELGHMPSQPELRARKRFDLLHVIAQFGGQPAVAQMLGYPYTGRKSWKHVEELRPHLQPLVDELHRMPAQAELAARERFDLINAITKFGGLAKVAEVLGYAYAGPKTWEHVEDLRPYLQSIVEELGRMPSKRELIARGRHDLVMAIRKFGGHPKVAETLGYSHTPLNSWNFVEDLRPHLDPIVDELRRMPTVTELIGRKRFDLLRAIQKFHGQSAVAEALGYPYDGRNAWDSIGDLRFHLDPIVKELGRMPGQKDL